MLTDHQRLAALARYDLSIKLALASHGQVVAGAVSIDRRRRENSDLSLVVAEITHAAQIPALVADWARGWYWEPDMPMLQPRATEWLSQVGGTVAAT